MATFAYLAGSVAIRNGRCQDEQKRVYEYNMFVPCVGGVDIEGIAHIYVRRDHMEPEDGVYRVSGRMWIESGDKAVMSSLGDEDEDASAKEKVRRDVAIGHHRCCLPKNLETKINDAAVLHLLFNEGYDEDLSGERNIPMLTIAARVSRRDDTQRCLDFDFAHYGIRQAQSFRAHCFYPSDSVRLSHTPVPEKDSHVTVFGSPASLFNGRCLVHTIDVMFGPRGLSSSQSAAPPAGPSKTTSPASQFKWGSKKRKSDDDDAAPPVAGPSK